MSKVCQISSQLIVLAGTIALVVTGFSTVAAADTEVNAAVVVVVSDDIMDKTTDIARPGDGAVPAAAGGGGGDDGDAAAGDDGNGNGNNGHGNNLDGVDSSNRVRVVVVRTAPSMALAATTRAAVAAQPRARTTAMATRTSSRWE